MASFSGRGAHFRGLVIVLLVGFLIGFLPMWLRARQRTTERDQALQKLQASELKDQLSAAALDSRRGQYETARQELSGFFTSLDTVMGRKNDPNITPNKVKSLPELSQRDELITLLARSDPASADRLSDLDLAFRKAVR
jgi:predicted lipid-binding transport protein (Tim44 family)